MTIVHGDEVQRFELPTTTCEIGGALGSSVNPSIARQTIPCQRWARHVALDGLGHAFVIDDTGALRGPVRAASR